METDYGNKYRKPLFLCVDAGFPFGRHGNRTVSTDLWLVAGHLLTGQLRYQLLRLNSETLFTSFKIVAANCTYVLVTDSEMYVCWL